jgi:alkylhydroperoxidase/carboxymuconolactone decarboxylase family protein YurZ
VILSAKEVELLSIGFDASHTDMYAPEMRRHIRKSPAAGVAVEEIMEVLKLFLVQGVQACNLGMPILDAEIVCRRGLSGVVHEQ